MVSVGFEISESVLSGLHEDPEGFTRELRLAAAVKWYELRRVSQGRAAEIAGLSRSEFIDALNRYQVNVFQYSAKEIIAESEL